MSGIVGKRLGKYQILEQLGRGGMAEVYKAYQPGLDRYVAVKVLHGYLSEDPQFRARFQREAKHVASLRHPNIVQAFDFDVQEGLYYMVMEFIPGATLKRRIAELHERGETMPLGETRRIVAEVASALAYAHERGVVHRDVKPANVILDETGRAVLTDFGVAKILSGTQFTASGTMLGTPAYMPPEVGLGETGDARSDIYSLGVILFELATGRLPFDADTPLAIVLKHVNDPLPPPRSLVPALGDDIERVILKALSKDPTDRYQTANEMALRLTAPGLITSAPLTAAPVPPSPAPTPVRPPPLPETTPPPSPSPAAPIPRLPPARKSGARSLPFVVALGFIALACLVGGTVFGAAALRRIALRRQAAALVTDVPTLLPASPGSTVVGLAKTAAPFVPASVLFQDDFSDPSSGWERMSGALGSSDYINGAFRFLISEINSDLTSTIHMTLTDVSIDVDAAKIGGPDDNDFGVICSHVDGDNFYFFVISSDGYFGIGKQSGGDQALLGAEALKPHPAVRQGAATNHIRADCVGESLALHVNGVHITTVKDREFSSGKVGLFAGTYEIPGTEIAFDNFTIRGP